MIEDIVKWDGSMRGMCQKGVMCEAGRIGMGVVLKIRKMTNISYINVDNLEAVME